MDLAQRKHDLTVALVAATAREHTPSEYVRLYRELYGQVDAEVERESAEYRKGNPILGWDSCDKKDHL